MHVDVGTWRHDERALDSENEKQPDCRGAGRLAATRRCGEFWFSMCTHIYKKKSNGRCVLYYVKLYANSVSYFLYYETINQIRAERVRSMLIRWVRAGRRTSNRTGTSIHLLSYIRELNGRWTTRLLVRDYAEIFPPFDLILIAAAVAITVTVSLARSRTCTIETVV